ncbi:hypothetical protein I8752_00450 [Nostocaceae cyanobacterium CENA369]|uniref:Uncharacterized protein n=1 Tax=Dendronalium phyllosphericum CENA369 TaxID=1725256 RepID=A0A8J7HZW5_9NOST|nr:TylF/MycF family methyltransferase [Dendronalium phyllosphericum]MBH8571518.1 hypothetical protein [Dendronalium phyllosphericum CENA369]
MAKNYFNFCKIYAHIDCDWYEPVKFCLESIYPILSKGDYIALDDYYDYGGCKKAVNEFIAKHNDIKIVNDDRNLILLHH